MPNSGNHNKITYIEFASTDIERTKRFYNEVFGWEFRDWGPEYISFAGAGVEGGGFYKTDPHIGQPRSRRSWSSIPQTSKPLRPRLSPPAAASSSQPSSFPVAVAFISLTASAMCLEFGRSKKPGKTL